MDGKKNDEPDIAVSAVTGDGGPPVPEGHVRHHCEKCGAVSLSITVVLVHCHQ